MKKVLSFVLVLSMILGSFGMAFAAPADVVGTDYEDAVNVLTELGVIAGYKDGSFKPENVVTRAEMATFIVKAMGLADYAVGKSEFSDMAGHWADPFVAYAVSLGFVKGNTDGTFAPDATVSYDQAITMLVQALGYKAEYLVGGYPGAFVNQAKALGMLEDVKSGVAGANRGDVATLIFNTLGAKFVRYDNQGLLQESETDCMIARLADVRSTETFVVTEATEGLVDLDAYFGAYVQAYLDKDGEIIAVKDVKSEFLTGKINADGKFVVGDVKYTINDGYLTPGAIEAGSNTTTQAVYFENGYSNEGAITTTKAVAVGNTVTIAAKVSGKIIKEVYSIADWNASETIMWNEDAAEELTEDFKIGSASFAQNDNEEIDTDTFVLEGVAALADIKEDDIVTVYEGVVETETVIVKVAVSRDVVEGKVAKVDKDGDFVINGKTYVDATQDANYGVSNDTSDIVGLAKEGKFYLNADGDIAFFDETVTEADNYAMVTYDMKNDTEAYGEDGVLKIKLLTADGKEAVYVVKNEDVVTITGSATTTGSVSAGAVVKYHVDKNGKLDVVERYVTSAMISADNKTLSQKGYMDGKKVASNVVVFTLNDDAEWTVATLADVPVDTDLGATYYLTNSVGQVSMIVLDDTIVTNDDSVYAVLVDYAVVENEDEVNVFELSMLVDGAAKTYYTTTTTVAFTTDGALFELVFTGSEVSALNPTGTSIAAATTTVEAIKDGNIKVSGSYVDLADDVVVYEYDYEKETMVASSLSKISKGDFVVTYEVDDTATEIDYVDYVIFMDKDTVRP